MVYHAKKCITRFFFFMHFAVLRNDGDAHFFMVLVQSFFNMTLETDGVVF